MHNVQVLRQLTPSGHHVRIVERRANDFHDVMRDTEYLIGYADKEMDDDFYANASALKMIQLTSAGYDKVNIESAQRAGVAVCNNGGANSGPVAEHAFMLMLALARQLFRQHEEVVSGRWQRDGIAQGTFTLDGLTLGIVGLGTIGKKAARLGRAFGMNVQYFDVTRLSEDAEGQLGVKFRLLDELLSTSDFVTLHMPFLPSTHHMFGKEQFARMKKTAHFINCARGEVVDEPALYEALASGTIAGAGLDVFEQEAPSAQNPIFKLKNVVLTAHLAGPVADTQYTKFRNAFDNILRVERGERPLWIIPEMQDHKLRLDQA